MKKVISVAIAIVEWTALAAAITFGCSVGAEGASAIVNRMKENKKERKEVIPEKVSAMES